MQKTGDELEAEREVPVEFVELIRVTNFGHHREEWDGSNSETPPEPGKSPRDCKPGEPWLVQCSGGEGESFRQALQKGGWIFEELVRDLLGDFRSAKAGTKELAVFAESLPVGAEADRAPRKGHRSFFNVWYRAKEVPATRAYRVTVTRTWEAVVLHDGDPEDLDYMNDMVRQALAETTGYPPPSEVELLEDDS
jgi:hypothetical protein